MKVKCSNCGKIIKKEEYRTKLYKNLFCNRSCKYEWQSKQRGENTPRFKHGKSIGSKFNCLMCGKGKVRTSYMQKYCSTSCQLNYEYKNESRNRFEITKKANETIRKFGNPKLRGKPSWMMGKTKANGLYPKNVGFQRGAENVINKFPEKHPNFILAKKGHKTCIEKEFEKYLLEKGIDFEFQKRIGKYWVDFYLPSRNLIVELDGNYWHKKPNAKRDLFIKNQGFNLKHILFEKYSQKHIKEKVNLILEEVDNG